MRHHRVSLNSVGPPRLHLCVHPGLTCSKTGRSHFNTPEEDRRACEAAVGADLQPQCTYVPAPEDPTDSIGSACPQDLLAQTCTAARSASVGNCLRCIDLHTDLRSCTEDETDTFCTGGADPCASFDCGGHAEGHCAALNDGDMPACTALVEGRAWDADPAGDETACNAVGFAQYGRTGAVCQYYPGGPKGQCQDLTKGESPPTCECLGHWRAPYGSEGSACTETCTQADLVYPGVCWHGPPPHLNPDANGGTPFCSCHSHNDGLDIMTMSCLISLRIVGLTCCSNLWRASTRRRHARQHA
jgi:hypothetical protein